MTLYLHPSITPSEIKRAHAAGIRGVKSYPRGVTTNSEGGIEDYEVYYPVFKEMENCGMVLNLHGEVPSDDEKVRRVVSLSSLYIYNHNTNSSENLFAMRSFPKHRIYQSSTQKNTFYPTFVNSLPHSQTFESYWNTQQQLQPSNVSNLYLQMWLVQ